MDRDMEFVIGFHQNKNLKEARFNALIDNASYIFPIKAIQVAGSFDGVQFKTLNEIRFPSWKKDDFNIRVNHLAVQFPDKLITNFINLSCLI